MREYLDGDRTCVFQWDNNRRLILDGFPEGCVVAYSNECYKTAPVVESYTENGILYADIPPEIMQEPHCIEADVRMDGNTIHKTFVTLIPGARPDDYVMEPVEVLRYESLAKRISALEESGTGGGGSIIVDEDGYLTTTAGGFEIDEDGYIVL